MRRARRPQWSVESRRRLADRQVVFGAQRLNKWLLIQKPANGLGAETVLFESDRRLTAMATSPDATHVVFQRPSSQEDIWVLALDGKSKPWAFQASSSIDVHPQVSPNGKWLAYGSTEGGSGPQIYIRSFPEGSEKRTVSVAGGRQPRWRADGRELFFVESSGPGAAGSMMAVDVQEMGSTLQLGQPKKLFDNDYFDVGPDVGGNYHTYAASADGQRFLIPRASAKTGSPRSQPIIVSVNWASTMTKR